VLAFRCLLQLIVTLLANHSNTMDPKMNPPPLSLLHISKKGSRETEASDTRSLVYYTPDADEARCIVDDPLPMDVYSPVTERLIDESRVLQKSASGKYWVDMKDAISEDLALRVSKVASMLVINVYNGTRRSIAQVFGQAGLIKRGRDTILVTSLHNLTSEDKRGSDRLFAVTALLGLSNNDVYTVDFDALSSRTWKRKLKSLTLRDYAIWSYGRDMAWGRLSRRGENLPLPPLPAFETVAWKKEQYVSSSCVATVSDCTL
jgi:hypothetical protein